MKLLLDEALSPWVSRQLREVDGIDAVSVRDRGKLGQPDHIVMGLAYSEDRIVVTTNVKDFEKLASASEVHCGVVFIWRGELDREEQLAAVRRAIVAIEAEEDAGRDTINRVLYIEEDGESFQLLPP